MAAKLTIDADKKLFILNNAGKMKQCEIARLLNTSPSTVNGIIKGKRGVNIRINNVFNIDEFAKHYQY